METYIPDALFLLLTLCFIAQLFYLINFHSRLRSYPSSGELTPVSLPVSVIISARNEAVNLAQNLPSILGQNYPDFEVVVINDCSIDDSENILKAIGEKYAHLKIVNVKENEKFKTGKKFALTMGIKACKNDYLLFTDADCLPASPDWITRMTANFSETKQIVLGYSPYSKSSGFLNALIRFETMKTAMNYLSAALAGYAYMGIGRNMAYTKALFFKSKGFGSHMHVMSGDDDLFVNQNATSDNTTIEIHPDAFTFSDAKNSISSFFRQKRRHAGAGKLYKNKHRRMLSFDALSGLLFYILLILSIILNYDPWPALGLFLFRWIVQLLVYYKVFKKLDGKNFLWYLPIFDLVYYVYLNIFGLMGIFIKTKQWK